MSAVPSTPDADGHLDISGTRDRWTVTGTVLAAAAIAVSVAAGIAAVLPASTVADVLGSDHSLLVQLGLPAVRAVFDLSAALTIGWLLAAVVLAPPRTGGRFDVSGYRCALAASMSALVWCVAALALVPLSYANTAGTSLLDALSADSLLGAIAFLEASEAALYVAILAALIGILARVVLRPAAAFGLLLLACVAILPVAVSGHAAASSDHDLATDTVIFHVLGVCIWTGGLVAFLGLARQRAAHLDLIARRYSALALAAFVVVAASGLGNALVRLPRLADLVTSDYGRLVLLKIVLLAALGAFGYLQRRESVRGLQRGDRASLLRLAGLEIGVMAATVGVAVALGRSPTPPPLPVAPSDLELLLGFSLPGPPTLGALLTAWRFDVLFGTAALGLAALYAWGLLRLRRRGTDWPVGRSVAWFLGCSALLLATSSGLGRYGEAQFSVHMMGHMLLGMLAPILLVLGAPTTLALRALPASRGDGVPGAREAIVGVMHSRPVRWLTHPLIVFVLFVGSLYVLYFSPLFDWMVRSHVGHVAMTVHFLAVGYLYYWVIIGIDPSPRRLSPLVKLAMLLGALPFHAFFGLALMNTRTLLGASWYQGLDLPWIGSLLSDQHLAGAIAWGGAEIPLVVVILALLAQWSRGDAKEARRADRRAELHDDAELTAYNAMLGKLADDDQRRLKGNQPGAGGPQ